MLTVSTYIVFEATVYRVEFSHLITLYTVLYKSCKHQYRQCRQTYIAYTIHNSIALILCINCLDMPFNVHTTDKVTVSGFLTI